MMDFQSSASKSNGTVPFHISIIIGTGVVLFSGSGVPRNRTQPGRQETAFGLNTQSELVPRKQQSLELKYLVLSVFSLVL